MAYTSSKRGLDLPRLLVAMRRGRWMLERMRANRREMVRAYTGFHWNEEGAREAQPINLIALFVQTVSRRLLPEKLRFLLSTFNRNARPVVSAMEGWINQEIERMQLVKSLKRTIIDSLFSIGISKVALATPSDSAQENWGPVAGEPFHKPVDIDDYVVDAHARHDEEVSFEGHRYRVPLDTVRDSRLYTRARKELVESYDQPYNLEGDERIGMLGRGYKEMMTQEYVPHVDLWEVYMPAHRLIVTLADEWMSGASVPTGGEDEGLRVQEWIGHERGPYPKLRMLDVPGNLMPKAPIQDLFDLHEDVNRGYRKIERTMDRIKEILLVRAGKMEDGSYVQTADDGDIVRCDDPAALQQVVMGGQALQQILAVVMDMREQFNKQSGNLDLLAGLAPQSKTAHQDAMLNANSAQGIQDYQEATTAYVADVGERLCWYFHHDPQRVMRAVYSVPGLRGMDYRQNITPEMRQRIPFNELGIRLAPYSPGYGTPQQRMQAVNNLLQQIYLPLAAQAQQQGITLDLHSYFEKAGKWIDEPELDELFTIVQPPQAQAGPGQEAGPAKPVATERNYTRESIPGRTQKSNEATMMSALLGHNPGGNSATTKNGVVR